VVSSQGLRAAVTAASTDIIAAPVVNPPPSAAPHDGVPPTYDEAVTEVTEGVAAIEMKSPAVAAEVTPSPSPPPPAAVTPAKLIDGAANPENPPLDLQLIWSDPNIDKDWNAASVDEFKEKGLKWLAFESATEVVAWFTQHPQFLRSDKLRVMSNNRIYTVSAHPLLPFHVCACDPSLQLSLMNIV
jgi:hypothetical protein